MTGSDYARRMGCLPPTAGTLSFQAGLSRVTVAHLMSRVDSGELTVDVAQRVSLSELPEIHVKAAAGELRGKVVALPDTN